MSSIKKTIIQNGQPMSNGKRFNRTVVKYADKRMSKHLFDTYPKADETKMYHTKYTLRGKETGKYTGIVFYSLKNFVNSDEFDVVVKMVHRDGKEVDISVIERVEFHSAALNDYFINHDAT